jgi:hypothetical protein
MAKTLSINDKINIRAWLKCYKNVFIDQSVLVRLPVRMLPQMVYALSGRSVGLTNFTSTQSRRRAA